MIDWTTAVRDNLSAYVLLRLTRSFEKLFARAAHVCKAL